ncbi:hypothetical protein KQX54_004065 [Cotesia glomerata]|uniref:Uncharacterized protein n=1 Tax=Cotesia glomerata TaxID=32391 RepID=A0AAV7IPE7_COTGL|nr:hypothetical protein KQX54_004065 [Cotesia glomerata]
MEADQLEDVQVRQNENNIEIADDGPQEAGAIHADDDDDDDDDDDGGDDEGDAATGHWLRSQSTRSVNTIRNSALKVVRLVRDHPGSMIRRDDLFASNFLRRVSLFLSLICFARIGW